MLICYGTGTSMFFNNEQRKQGIIFLVVGSLLFPLFLLVTFRELKIFTSSSNYDLGLTISLLSLILYLVSSSIFRFPIWAFLYHSIGLSVFYFFLKFIGIVDGHIMAWLFLILGTVYLFLSLFYDKSEQKDEGHYSYTIGTLVIILSLIRLYNETFNQKEYLAWILFLLGIAYFLVGIFYEKNNFKKYCQAPYLIGTGTVFFSLLRLASEGTLLRYFTGNTASLDEDTICWSNFIIGMIYLIFAYIIEKLKNIGFKEALKQRNFFNIVGPLWVLGTIFYLGLGGKKPVYETLLLLSSLSFIFGSIPRLTRQYLYIGTIFLIIYIISIGGEYFQNEVGWPITLFIAGLTSMGISIFMEKIRRKYFTNQGSNHSQINFDHKL